MKTVPKGWILGLAVGLVSWAPLAAQNLAENYEFDNDVLNWDDTPPFNDIQWNTADHSGCGSASGSAEVTHLTDAPSSVNFSYCLEGIVGGLTYSTGAYFRIPAGQTPTGSVSMNVSFYNGVGCSGTLVNQAQVNGINTSETGVWVRGANDAQPTAASAVSALFRIALTKTVGNDPLMARVDGIWLYATEGFLFADNFGTESTCRWDLVSP
jgi:hypothetical protein